MNVTGLKSEIRFEGEDAKRSNSFEDHPALELWDCDVGRDCRLLAQSAACVGIQYAVAGRTSCGDETGT
jgi:hypothetical protein